MEFFGFLPPASAPAAANNEVQLAGPFPDSIGVASPSTHAASPSSAADLAVPVFAPDEKMILEEPVQLKDFTAVHERALAYMRWRRDRAIAEEPHIAPSAEAARDDRLWRFLIAKQFDALAAGNMYVDMLRWRHRSGMDAIRSALLAANPLFFEDGSDTLQAIYLSEDDRRMLEEVYPRTWCKTASSGGDADHEPLYDRHGNLVYIEAPAYVAWPDVAAAGSEAYSIAALRGIELLQLVLDELTKRTGRLVLTSRVIDLLDYRVVNPFKGSKEKEGERIAKEVGRPFSECYPTTTYKNFLINAPAANIIKPLVTMFVPARSAKKTVILGSKFAEELHRECDPSNLPAKLGGKLPDGLQWTKGK